MIDFILIDIPILVEGGVSIHTLFIEDDVVPTKERVLQFLLRSEKYNRELTTEDPSIIYNKGISRMIDTILVCGQWPVLEDDLDMVVQPVLINGEEHEIKISRQQIYSLIETFE